VKTIILCFLLLLVVVFVVPILVYASFLNLTGLQSPGDSPAIFLLGVFISKAGMAAALVLLFHLGQVSPSGRWFRYAATYGG
jgi:hypothetical protein